MSTHTAIAALAKGKSDAIQVETPKPGPGQVLLKVAYASMIAFDTYITDIGYGVADKYPVTLGFNAAGTVVQAGEGSALKVGDRIIAFSVHIFAREELQGTMQEFVVLPDHLCAKIREPPSQTTLSQPSTSSLTSFLSPFHQASPHPIPHRTRTPPILIYGAGSTTGQYTLQLLHAAGYTNIVATASPRHHAFLRSLGATRVLDYASPTLASDIAQAVGGDGKIALAVDAISADGTIAKIAQVLRPGGAVAFLLPIKVGDTVAVGDAGMRSAIPDEQNPFSNDTKIAYVRTFTYRQNEYLKNNLMPKILPQLLFSGIIQPNKVRLLAEGTLKERVAAGLDLLRNNKVSGEKVIVKVA
ncbi:PKS-ER domain-containing protein [Mycena sanguinolenta]|uniref:PKS-ER domain-containing protein n=1 Tax=Mycena sanguinolenta TaxID=230812 RepID=A0A8H7DG84_9AGAR|nr:PKS-ER domain-containing protein [Mycena sanguinolenta]